MKTKNFDYYSFEKLYKKAISKKASQIDIDTLGEWFTQFGMMDWNGEFFNVDDVHELVPVYSDPDEAGDFEILHYEMR